MRWSPLRFWLITSANGLILVLMLLAICGTLIALAAMAPEIDSWPLFTFGSIGIALTTLGLYFTRLARTGKQRWIGWLVHGASLTLYVLIAVFITTSWLRATRRTFLLTDGFKGDFYVLYVPSSTPHELNRHWRTTYRIPADGILVTNDPMPESMNDKYAYVRTDGTTRQITDMEYSTISDTPQNRSDFTPIVYFPRTGSFQSRSGCKVQYEQVYVGTKADLLANYKRSDVDSYVATHPALCSAK
jgi:hypothetical protein